MTGLNHVLTGVVIGAAVQRPILVVPIAFVSHFVLDMLPHFGGHPLYKWGHKHFPKILIIDGVLSIGAAVIAMILLPELTLPIALGAFFAAMPDFLWIDFFGRGNHGHWFHKFHKKIQWYERPPGAVVELVFLLTMGSVIFRFL